MNTDRGVRVWSEVDSGAVERDEFVTSLVHHETANCTTQTRQM